MTAARARAHPSPSGATPPAKKRAAARRPAPAATTEPDGEIEAAAGAGAGVDGRTARRDRNRVAVLDAVIELFSEDNLDPSPEDVATRSGVSIRSVYRYFTDPEELLRAAIDRHLEGVLPLARIHAIGEGPLDERIERFVTSRLRLYEAIAPAARAARIAAARNEIIREQTELTRRSLRDQVERNFAPELRPLDARTRKAVAGAADALGQLETLDYYRIHRRLSSRDTADILTLSLARLLAP